MSGKVVVGLGNPGERYAETRHNVGWMVLDRLAERGSMSGHARARDGAAVVRGRCEGLDLVLVKPTTYMNLSGIAVRKILARERAPLADLVVVVDDFALPLGRLRLREEGSAGGHNGLRSIIAEMETQRFARLRVGIGEPARGAVEHVLRSFTPAERRVLDECIDAAASAVLDWAREGPVRAASRWNAWRPEGERTSRAPAAPSSAELPASSGEGTEPESAPRGRSGGETPDGAPAETAPHGRVAASPDDPVIVRTRTGWRRLLPERRDARPGDGS